MANHGRGEGDVDVLAEQTMVTTGAMTKGVDRLEQAGLVARRVSESDGRGRVVALTPAGR